MFGAEPQEKWTVQEATEFEAEAAKDLFQKVIRAGWATAVFVGTMLAVTPFLYGHSLHAYWEKVGKYLVILAMSELLWIVLWWGFVYASWQSAREVRREMTDME